MAAAGEPFPGNNTQPLDDRRLARTGTPDGSLCYRRIVSRRARTGPFLDGGQSERETVRGSLSIALQNRHRHNPT